MWENIGIELFTQAQSKGFQRPNEVRKKFLLQLLSEVRK